MQIIKTKSLTKRLDDREKLVEAHNKGKLSKSFYSKGKNGKPFLSPHNLHKKGY